MELVDPDRMYVTVGHLFYSILTHPPAFSSMMDLNQGPFLED